MARILLKKNVTVRGKGWKAFYHAGRYYSENHAEFLASCPESWELVKDKSESDLFEFEEPDLVDGVE